jgi:hypothetical protein
MMFCCDELPMSRVLRNLLVLQESLAHARNASLYMTQKATEVLRRVSKPYQSRD